MQVRGLALLIPKRGPHQPQRPIERLRQHGRDHIGLRRRPRVRDPLGQLEDEVAFADVLGQVEQITDRRCFTHDSGLPSPAISLKTVRSA